LLLVEDVEAEDDIKRGRAFCMHNLNVEVRTGKLVGIIG
jgi:ABC-type glutathione transport system ATPase component